MSLDCQDRVREITEQVRAGQYTVDPRVVAGAIVSRLVWDDVPEILPVVGDGPGPRRVDPPRLRGLIRVGKLVPGLHAPGAPARA